MKNHMRFDVLTLFPQMFEAVLGDSIIGRARENNILEMNFIDIRDFSTNKHRKVDDYPYSGGGGMLMTHSLCMTRICLLRRNLIINRLRYICRRRERCLIKVSRSTLQIMSISFCFAVIMRVLTKEL